MTVIADDDLTILELSTGVTAWTETQQVYSSRIGGSVGPHLSVELMRSIGGHWVAGLSARYEYALYLDDQKPRPTAHRGSLGGVLAYLFGEGHGYRHGPRFAVSPYFNGYREENREDTSFGGILDAGWIGLFPRNGFFWSLGLEAAAAHGTNPFSVGPYLSYGLFTGVGIALDANAREPSLLQATSTVRHAAASALRGAGAMTGAELNGPPGAALNGGLADACQGAPSNVRALHDA